MSAVLGVTVNPVLFEIRPKVAVMVVEAELVCEEEDVMTKPVALIVAAVVLEEVQITELVIF